MTLFYKEANEKTKMLILEAISTQDLTRQKMLAYHKSMDIRNHLADNRFLAPEIQLILSADEDITVLSVLAKNDNITLETQTRLLQREFTYVNLGLLENINLEPEILQQILMNHPPEYRLHIITQYNHPETQQLAKIYTLLK